MPEPNFYEPGLNQGESIEDEEHNHTKTLAEWLNEKDQEETN